MKLTISALPRAVLCPPSVALPAVRDVYPAPARERGTAGHAFLRDIPTKGVVQALAAAPEEYREFFESINLDRLDLDPTAWAQEVAVAYDYETDTAREINRGTDSRDYRPGPSEVPGRADIVGLTPDAVVVVDAKFTRRWLGSPAESWQLRGYALAFARLFGRDRAIVKFARIGGDGEPVIIEAELDAFDLDDTAERIRKTANRIGEVEGLLSEGKAVPLELFAQGEHCTFCPAFGTCPAKVALFAPLGADLAAIERAQPEKPAQVLAERAFGSTVLTSENAGAFHRRIELVEKALEHAKKIRDEYATGSPIRLEEGRVYAKVEVEKETIDPMIGAIILAEAYGQSVATAAVEREEKLTKASLKRALQAWQSTHPGNKITHLERAAHERLREAKGMRVARYAQFKEFKPKESDADEGQQEGPVESPGNGSGGPHVH